MTIKIGNIKFNKFTLNSAQKKIVDVIETGKKCHQVVIANAYSLVIAHKDKSFSSVCESADIVFADGLPVVWASILLGDRIPERIAGPDFMWSFSRVCAEKGYGIFLMGSEEPYLSKLQKNLHIAFDGINIVGTYSPPFGKWCRKENKKIVTMINKSKADILWVGISTPKQDIWIKEHQKELNAKIAFGVGAAFDFHSGRIERAPKWIQKIGFEWLFRFFQDPRRLWRRYFIGNLQFIYLILCDIIKKNF
jgi:N-acetylglucosaminyldiphosphoundecaprenol N-acetyl-beta-D-mannosaminyltransferase